MCPIFSRLTHGQKTPIQDLSILQLCIPNLAPPLPPKNHPFLPLCLTQTNLTSLVVRGERRLSIPSPPPPPLQHAAKMNMNVEFSDLAYSPMEDKPLTQTKQMAATPRSRFSGHHHIHPANNKRRGFKASKSHYMLHNFLHKRNKVGSSGAQTG